MLRATQASLQSLLLLTAGWVLLDGLSNIQPLYGLNVTPWNPAPALGLVFLMRFGKPATLPIVLAIMIGDLLWRELSVPLLVSALLALQLTLSYWAIAEVLHRHLPDGGIFSNRRGLIEWAVIVAFGTLVGSLLFTGSLVLFDLIPVTGAKGVLVQFWVGDAVGILVSMPILWMLFDEGGRAQLRAVLTSWESFGYLLATCLALWVAFGLGGENEFKYFYVLFLPVVWAAARHGLAGAILSAAALQAGLIVAALWLGFSAVSVRELQAFAVVLALLGFFVGVVVDEKQRVSSDLRQTLRLAAAGEMAGALAHELNQPLTALSAYGTACTQLLAMGETGERLRETIGRMVAESLRAADVVRRLRDFFRTGATHLETIELKSLFNAVESAFADKAGKLGIELVIGAPPACTLLADRLQLEVVLRNLVTNAFDAIAEHQGAERRVSITAQLVDAGQVCISVADTGPGLTGAAVARMFEAFHSSKSSGLGLGLTISRAIAEAHGGTLMAEVDSHGMFKLMLPVAGGSRDAG